MQHEASSQSATLHYIVLSVIQLAWNESHRSSTSFSYLSFLELRCFRQHYFYYLFVVRIFTEEGVFTYNSLSCQEKTAIRENKCADQFRELKGNQRLGLHFEDVKSHFS